MVEVWIATVYSHGRSIMIAANIPDDVKHTAGQKAFETATKLDNLVPVMINGVTKS